MARASVLPPGIAPRGLNLAQASEYLGCCPSTFKKLVATGVAPPPIRIPGLDRAIFDRQDLDRVMSELTRAAKAGDAS
jgi:hypothetical protein